MLRMQIYEEGSDLELQCRTKMHNLYHPGRAQGGSLGYYLEGHTTINRGMPAAISQHVKKALVPAKDAAAAHTCTYKHLQESAAPTVTLQLFSEMCTLPTSSSKNGHVCAQIFCLPMQIPSKHMVWNSPHSPHGCMPKAAFAGPVCQSVHNPPSKHIVWNSPHSPHGCTPRAALAGSRCVAWNSRVRRAMSSAPTGS
eukprot:100908-Pelagomonas_calceolata.AAC.1